MEFIQELKRVDSLEVIKSWTEDGIEIKQLRITKEEYEARLEFYMKSTMLPRMLNIVEPIPFAEGFKEQYTYSKNGNRISMMKMEGLDWEWEIYVLDGDIKLSIGIDGMIEGFQTKEEAHARIKELLS